MNEDVMYYEDDIVSYEEKVVVESSEESILAKIGRGIFYAFLFLFPLWFLPSTNSPADLHKAYFAAIALFGAFMLTLAGALQEGRVRLVGSKIFAVSVVFLLLVLIASLSSLHVPLSLWGVGSEPTIFIHFLLAIIALFLAPMVITSRTSLNNAFFFLGSSFVIVFVSFFLKSILNLNIFPWAVTGDRGFTVFGSWNTIALYFGFGAALFAPFVGLRSGWFMKFAGIWFGLMLIGVLLANFTSAWLGLGVVALFFVALVLSQRQQRSRLFAIAMLLLLSSVLFYLLSDTLGFYFRDRFNGFGRPNEVVPSYADTIGVVRESLMERPVFGGGPNTFALAWDKFKTAEWNNGIFWQIRFTSGTTAFLTLMQEIGFLGILGFLAVIGIFLWQGFRAMGLASGDGAEYVRSFFAGGAFLVLMWFLYPLNFALTLLTFLTIGFFYVALRETHLAADVEIDLFRSKERGFVFSLIIIFLLVGGIGGIYYQTTRYIGSIAFARGLELYRTQGAANSAQKEIQKAYQTSPDQDQYFRTYAQLELVKLNRILNDSTQPREEQSKAFLASYGVAKEAAERAVALGGNDATNYRILGQVYESGMIVDPAKALSLVLETYEKAKKLSPTDPSILVDMARAHLTFADLTLLRGGGSTSRKIASDERQKAIDLLVEATKLKPDYAQAHFTLSQLYVTQGEIDQAISRAQTSATLSPDNTGVWFQLGLLYYRKEDFASAKVALEKALSITSNFSNARYFLGLIYDKEGDAAKALEQFQRIQELNPNDKDVARIIAALNDGKKAADVIGTPPPEDRKEAPLEDSEKIKEEIPKQ